MDGSDGTREDTEDTTMLVQIEEVKRVIRALSFVTTCDKTVDCRRAQRQGVWVGGLSHVLFLPWLLWKEARTTSSILV